MIKINKKTENVVILILFLILFLILTEGFLCRPLIGPKLYIPCYLDNSLVFCKYGFCSKSFIVNVWKENGFVENLQALILIFSIFLLIKAKNIYSKNKLINYFLIIKIIALIYYLGEEISWGQHFFKWSSPDWFISNNNQKETNIHNVANLFDQLPRTLVLIWCALVAPISLFIAKHYDFNKNIFRILCPDKKLLLFSLTLLLFVIPDLVVDKFDLNPMVNGYFSNFNLAIIDVSKAENILILDNFYIAQNQGYFYDMVTFNFLKLSELHELLFCYYFLFYSIAITQVRKIF